MSLVQTALLINVILTLIPFINLQLISAPVISEYFKTKNVGAITILSCWDLNFKKKLIKSLSKNGLMVSYSLTKALDNPPYKIGAVFDLICDQDIMRENFKKFSDLKRFSIISSDWLLIDEGERPEELKRTRGIELLEDSFIMPASEVTLVQITPTCINYFDIFRITVSTPIKKCFLGTGPLNKYANVTARVDRSNFEQESLRSGTVLFNPDVFNDTSRPDEDTWQKNHYPLILNLAEQLNFTFSMIIMDNFGWMMDNGTFTGLMGYIQRGEIEFSEAGLFMREDRMKIIDFAFDTYQYKAKIIFKRRSLSTDQNIFLLPFSKQVWISLGALCVLVIGVLVLGIRTSKWFTLKHYTTMVSIPDMITMVFGHSCQQGTDLEAISTSARITIFIFTLSVVFFYTSYSANIVTLLQLTSDSIKTVKDLAMSPLDVKMQNRDFIKYLFEEDTDPGINALYKRKILPAGEKAYCEPEEGIEMMRKGPVAFYVELHMGYQIISDKYTEKEKCGIKEMTLFFLPRLSVPVAKLSGYRELFAQKLIRQREIGEIDRIQKAYVPQKPICLGQGNYGAVGFIDVFPAMLCLCYGSLFAIAIFLVELFSQLGKKMCKKRAPEEETHVDPRSAQIDLF